MMSERTASTQEMLDYLRGVPSGYITDTFSRLGLQGWLTDLQVTKPGTHIAGPAVTMQYAPIRGKKSATHNIYSVLRETAPGSVVVLAGASPVGVTVGGNVCTTAKVSGIEGMVLEGCLRDLEDIRELGLPVFYRKATIVRDFTYELVAVNEPVTCAGARVHAGDIIVMDEDGGTAIPAEYLEEVVANVRDVERLEGEQAELIQAVGPMDELKRILAAKKSPMIG